MVEMKENRRRNKTICFMVSEEERMQIEARIKVCGMPKAEYYIQSLLHQNINVVAGKYQSDRLSLELRKLSQKFDNHAADSDEVVELLNECCTLLKQIKEICAQDNIEQLTQNDFNAQVIKDKKKRL